MRKMFLAVLALTVGATACGKKERAPETSARDQSMKDMPGMGPMEGMDMGVPVDRLSAQRLGITFARAAMRPIGAGARAVGTLTYAEPRREYVNARVMGWVEKLYADYEGKAVRQGDALLALYAPELLSAQEEYLSAKRLGDSSLVAAARRRLTLWDIPEDQIQLLEQSGKAQRTLLLRAPIGGEIAEKHVTAGQAVQAGDNLFLIADRSLLWIELAIYESDARLLRVGLPVELTVDALPGKRYQGRVTFIHATVDTTTRTLTARAEVKNQDGELRPGMYVTARLTPASTQRLAVPLPAVLPTGTRQLVFVNRGDGQFVPREVQTGARSDSLVEIVRGLERGDEVIASATYLLDSESNLAAAMQGLMLQMGMGLNMGGMDMGGAAGQRDSGTDMKGMEMGKEERR